MVETLVLKLEKRATTGTAATRRLRAAGMIPVIIYGHGEAPVSAQVSRHDIALELQHRHRLLKVDLEGSRQQLLVKEVQYDHLYADIIHVDLTRVNLDERVTVTVPVELRGTPAGVEEGGVLDQVLADVEVECVVTAIPERIRANVAELNVGDSLLAKDLELPSGVKLVTEGDQTVASISVVAEEEEAPAAEEGEAEEPEVIGEKQEEEGEEQES